MDRIRTVVIGAATAALALAALGGPASALDIEYVPTAAFVNGVPGVTVDICINDVEGSGGAGNVDGIE